MITIKQDKHENMTIKVNDKLIFEGCPWDFPTTAVALRNFIQKLGLEVQLNGCIKNEPAKPVG